MIKQYLLMLLITTFTLGSIGCSTTRSTSKLSDAQGSSRYIYAVTSEQADKIIVEAMKIQFSNSSILKVELPYKGYFVNERFLLDSHEFTARMIPATARDRQGKLIDGFYFEVIDSGTMLISGSVRASNLLDKIIEIANKSAKPIPITQQ